MSIPVGELVILQNADYHTELNGQLCVVTGALGWRQPLDLFTMTYEWTWGYEVRPLYPDANLLTSRPDQVRRLRDPGDMEEDSSGGEEGLDDEIEASAFILAHQESD
jgi:hypothetical protein